MKDEMTEEHTDNITTFPKALQAIPVEPPPPEQRVQRAAAFPKEGERSTRYTLPRGLESPSPVGYRTRISLSAEEARIAIQLLSVRRPTAFAPMKPVHEAELFEESSLGLLIARQSTNYRGHRQITIGPDTSRKVAALLKELHHLEAPVLDGASYTHVILCRPYRTPFTMLLTLVGHKPLLSLFTVPLRVWRKRRHHIPDIPTIGYLTDLHIGILADAMERAPVLASGGTRRAQTFMAPFSGSSRYKQNRESIRALEDLCGMTAADRRHGWRIGLVSQVGEGTPDEQVNIDPGLCRKVGANLVSFRSERIQPGVNQDDKATAPYRERQNMDLPEAFTVQAGRAAYNAFAYWAGVDRERSKDLLILDRVDVLTPNGKERLRSIRNHLRDATDRVAREIPLWADLPSGKLFSRNTRKGRKAFALAGQRIYIAGLCRSEIEAEGVDWSHAIRALGACAGRSAVYAELMGCINIPAGCDLLTGICMMAGPVNTNDIAKEYYGGKDLLAETHPNRECTSLLVWTLKAKTVADPIGNEEQLMNTKKKGGLVDLRPGPHDVILIERPDRLAPMRQNGERVNQERAFADQNNFVTDASGVHIPGNQGEKWPDEKRNEVLW